MSIPKTLILIVLIFYAVILNRSFALVDKAAVGKENQADCIFIGQFIKIEEIKISGHVTRPVSLAVATFHSRYLKSGSVQTCQELKKGDFEVLFSTGKLSSKISKGEACDMPTKIGENYEIRIRVRETGGYIQASCYGWIHGE